MAAWSETEITRRALNAEGERSRITPWVEECLAYAMPWRRKWGSHNRLDFDRIFDSTALTAVPRFGGKLHAGLTPQFGEWFSLQAGPLVPKVFVDALNQKFEPVGLMVQAVLDASAYHLHADEMFSDLSVGTGALYIGEGDDYDLLRVDCAAPWALGIEAGPTGRIDNVYWAEPYPIQMLPRLWPKATWPQGIRDKIAAGSLEKVDILQASYFDTVDRFWRLAIVVRSGGDRQIVWESTNRTNPWIIPRYWTAPRDPWGRGPLMMALPDIKTANATVRMVLEAAAYRLAPPLMVAHDGVVNPDTLRMSPRALIRVARTGGPMGKSIEPMDIGSQVDLAQIVLEEQRGNIKRHLHDEQLPPLAGAVRSASEIIERAKGLAQDDGQGFTRLTHEVGPPLVTRVMDVLDRKKVAGIQFEQMRPDFLTLKVQMIGPLARAQGLEDAQSAIQWAEASRASVGDQAWQQSARTEDFIPYLARKMGVSPSLVRTAQERQQSQVDQAHMVAAAAAAGAAGGGGGVAGAAPAAPFATPSASPLMLPAPAQ